MRRMLLLVLQQWSPILRVRMRPSLDHLRTYARTPCLDSFIFAEAHAAELRPSRSP